MPLLKQLFEELYPLTKPIHLLGQIEEAVVIAAIGFLWWVGR